MSFLPRKIKKILDIWKKGGINGIRKKVNYRFNSFLAPHRYQKQAEKSDHLTNADRERIKQSIEKFKFKPKISIILPVYNVEEKWLRACLESVKKQLYPYWELCIADDNSPSPHVRRTLEEYTVQDSRIKVAFRETNGHISAASNSALELATGEFTALLDHDDELAEPALFYVVKEINDFPEVELIYSDEDKINEDSTCRFSQALKPDWSPDLMYSLNLVTHLAVFRTETLRKIGGWREGFEGSQDYDLVLRFYEQISDQKVRQIPKILYHWRAIQGSVALGAGQKSYAHERARTAIKEHLEKKGKKVKVIEAVENLHRVIYELPADLPKVDLIIDASDDKKIAQTIKDILSGTEYPNFQILVGTGNDGKISDDLKKDNHLKLIQSEKSETNLAAKLNKIVRHSDAEILVFLEGSVLPVEKDWLRELVSFVIQKEVGAVGAKLLFPDETVRASGINLNAAGFIEFAHRDLPRESTGEFFRARVVGNYPAVSGACLAIRREVFEAVSGFDAESFPNGLHDVDLCLRLQERGYRIVFTPYAELIQRRDSATENLISVGKKNKSPEVKKFQEKWQKDFKVNRSN